MAPGKKTQRSVLKDVVTREYTIHLAKRVFRVQDKKTAPRAVKEVVRFAQRAMNVKDVRVDPKLNEEIWSYGVKSVPRRIRVRLERKRNDDEDAKEKLYVVATPVKVDSFKGLETLVIDQE